MNPKLILMTGSIGLLIGGGQAAAQALPPAEDAGPPPIAVTTAVPDQIVNTEFYDCKNGTSLTVHFNDSIGNATIARDGRPELTLPQVDTHNATFDYTDGTHDFRGKHENATWSTSTGTSIKCQIE